MRRVRILVVGDAKVGKSSLIASLVLPPFQASFPTVVPSVQSDVSIPPSLVDDAETLISDTSTKPGDRGEVEKRIRKADVICVVYDVGRTDTFKRITEHWLPELRRVQERQPVPVVLVGNKIDIRGSNTINSMLQDEIIPIMTQYLEVETCVECSAKSLLNVFEVFFFAQKAVLYPSAPLYDARDHILKKECVSALKRIFKLCDADKDGRLNDQELNAFQFKYAIDVISLSS